MNTLRALVMLCALAPVFAQTTAIQTSPVRATEITTPANPAAGYIVFYGKGGAICALSSAGIETCSGTGGPGGGATVTGTDNAILTKTGPNAITRTLPCYINDGTAFVHDGSCFAELLSDNAFTGINNFSGASALIVKTGTSDPATCTAGSLLLRTDLAPGANLKTCTTGNIWTVNGGGSTGAAGRALLFSQKAQPADILDGTDLTLGGATYTIPAATISPGGCVSAELAFVNTGTSSKTFKLWLGAAVVTPTASGATSNFLYQFRWCYDAGSVTTGQGYSWGVAGGTPISWITGTQPTIGTTTSATTTSLVMKFTVAGTAGDTSTLKSAIFEVIR